MKAETVTVSIRVSVTFRKALKTQAAVEGNNLSTFIRGTLERALPWTPRRFRVSQGRKQKIVEVVTRPQADGGFLAAVVEDRLERSLAEGGKEMDAIQGAVAKTLPRRTVRQGGETFVVPPEFTLTEI